MIDNSTVLCKSHLFMAGNLTYKCPLLLDIPFLPIEGNRRAWSILLRGTFMYSINIFQAPTMCQGFPGSSVSKEFVCSAEDLGLTPGSGRSPEEGNGNPPQYSCLENPVDRGAWQATVHGVARIRHNLVTNHYPMWQAPHQVLGGCSKQEAVPLCCSVWRWCWCCISIDVKF